MGGFPGDSFVPPWAVIDTKDHRTCEQGCFEDPSQQHTIDVRSVTFAKRMPSANQSNELSPVPVHASKDISNGVCCTLGVGLAHGSLGIHVDQPESVLPQGVPALAVDLAAGEPLLLGRGSQRQRLRVVLKVQPARAEPQHGPAHLPDGDRPRQREQVAPADARAVPELDGLQEAARLVQVRVVGPGALGVKAASV